MSNNKSLGKKKIGIVGAGLAGLSCAYHLNKDDTNKDFEIKIFEKEATVGGRIKTKMIKGNLVHLGAFYYTSFYKTFINLFKELNIHPETINISSKEYSFLINNKPFNFTVKDFIFNSSIPFKEKINLIRLIIFTKSYISKLVKLLNTYEKSKELEITPFLPEFKKSIGNLFDIPLSKFVKDKYSKWILDNIIEPITKGTILSSSKDVAAYYGLGPLILISYTPKHIPSGIDIVAKKMSDKLNDRIEFNSNVTNIKKIGNKFNLTYTKLGKEYQENFDYIVITTPLTITKKIFSEIKIDDMKYGIYHQIYVSGEPDTQLEKKITLMNDESGIIAIIKFGDIYCIYSAVKNPDIDKYFKKYEILSYHQWQEGFPTIEPLQNIPNLKTEVSNLYLAGDFYYFPSMEVAVVTGKKVAEDIITYSCRLYK